MTTATGMYGLHPWWSPKESYSGRISPPEQHQQFPAVEPRGECAPDIEWQHLNYADYSPDPLGSYGRDNVELTWAAAMKHDSLGTF